MDTNRVWPLCHKVLSLVILLFSCVSPASADVRFPSLSADSGKQVCYCGCDSKPGTAMCTEMCDLSTYKGGSSAKRCESNQDKVRNMAPPASHTTSKKNNKIQSASL